METYDAVIFDMDGTLWDAESQVIEGWNRAYHEYTGKDGHLTHENFGRYFGMPMEPLLEVAFPDLTQAERHQLADRCAVLQVEVLRERPGRLYPGVLETIPKLAARYPLYILSNCSCGYIESLVEVYHLEPYFKGWICFGDNQQPKDQNLCLLKEQECLRSPVYVGDIQSDADACARAGVPIIHAAYGLGTVQHPAATLHQFSDLLEVLHVSPN